MFLNMLVIDEKGVRTILKNITETGATKANGRGRHGNHKTAEVREELVMQWSCTMFVAMPSLSIYLLS